MTTIAATAVADSISPQGKRLTTLQLRYPRFIHAELMTHRVFSRNARSSRAVPVETMLKEIESDPVVPLHWGANQKGMQADRECSERITFTEENGDWHTMPPKEAWIQASRDAVQWAKRFADAGYHKQVINRLLEPFMHIDVLVSATEWTNFLALRDHHMAEPHIAMLAREVKEAMNRSTPSYMEPDEWHLPYVSREDTKAVTEYLAARGDYSLLDVQAVKISLSVARCARISYKPFDGNASIEAEIARADALIGAAPMHASPAEHQATPDRVLVDVPYSDIVWVNPRLHGNFTGWCQFRKRLFNENITELAA